MADLDGCQRALDVEADTAAKARSLVIDAHAIFVLPNAPG